MPKIALVDGQTVLWVWTADEGQTEVATRYELPDGTCVSPIVVGWADGDRSVVAVSEFVVPEGKEIVGDPAYSVNNGGVVETFETRDRRPMIRKSVVQARLIAVGKMEDAYNTLVANPIYFARWFAPDHPEVYCDDPDAAMLLQAIGCDPTEIMASE